MTVHGIIRKSSNGREFYALIVANNNEVLFSSEMYTYKVDAIRAVALVNIIDVHDESDLPSGESEIYVQSVTPDAIELGPTPPQ